MWGKPKAMSTEELEQAVGSELTTPWGRMALIAIGVGGVLFFLQQYVWKPVDTGDAHGGAARVEDAKQITDETVDDGDAAKIPAGLKHDLKAVPGATETGTDSSYNSSGEAPPDLGSSDTTDEEENVYDFRLPRRSNTNGVLRAHCDDGNLAGCYNLGIRSLLGSHGRRRNVSLGQALLEEACPSAGPFYPKGCTILGNALNSGTYSIAIDHDRALQLLTRACIEAEYGAGCGGLGYAYMRGYGTDRDRKQARVIYMQACDLGWPGACFVIGTKLGRNRAEKSQHMEKYEQLRGHKNDDP